MNRTIDMAHSTQGRQRHAGLRLGIVLALLLAMLAAAIVGRGFLNRGDYAVGPGAAQSQATAYTNGRPNLVGAMFYSAWCSSCAVLEPRLRRILPEFRGRPVEFAKFDFSMGQPKSLTDKAKVLGVDQVYLSYKGTTGFMALIDRRTQKMVAMITLRQSDDDIRRSIEAAIKTSSDPVA